MTPLHRPYRRCKSAYPRAISVDGQRSVQVLPSLCRVQTVVQGSVIFHSWRRGCNRATLAYKSAWRAALVRATSRHSRAARHTAPQRCACTRVAVQCSPDRYRLAGQHLNQRCIAYRFCSVMEQAKYYNGGLGLSRIQSPAPSSLLDSSCTLPLVRDEYRIILRLQCVRSRCGRKGLAELFAATWLGHLSF